jgi:endoribonuclease Dicer
VQRSAVAFVIVELLRTLGEQASFLRPYALVGHSFNSSPNHLVRSKFLVDLSLLTICSQQDVFRTFATGGYNLLIATNSAEDLEIPKACIVVRYACAILSSAALFELC